MKNKIIVSSFAVLLLISIKSLYAVGIGIYASSTYISPSLSPGNYDNDKKKFLLGGGLALDTACANNSIFNYRLYCGFDIYHKKSFEELLSRIKLDNVFGFKIYSSQLVRIWLGPSLGIYYRYSRISIDSFLVRYNTGSISYNKYQFRDTYKAVSFPIGFSFGCNFNVSNNITISFDINGGYDYSIGDEYTRVRTMSIPSYTDKSPSYIFGRIEGNIRISLLYRINDYYKKI